MHSASDANWVAAKKQQILVSNVRTTVGLHEQKLSGLGPSWAVKPRKIYQSTNINVTQGILKNLCILNLDS